MYNYLIDHALENVWCNNEQDNQLIFQAFRVSRPSGHLNDMAIMKRKLDMPEKGKYYHIFQIGQVATSILGLLSIDPLWIIESWNTFSDSMNRLK